MTQSTFVKRLCSFAFIFLFAVTSFGQSTYNAYAKVTAIAGGNVLTVTNVNQVNHTFNIGEFVIVMQMQDDVIGANTLNAATFGDLSAIGNAGKFEVAQISSLAGGLTTIGLASPLVNVYNTGANSLVQVISFRRLSAGAFTSTNNITGVVWNSALGTGGVIAIEIPTIFTLNHSINANGLGFNGGVKNTPNGFTVCETITFRNALATRYAGKGEGIYRNTNAAFAAARGKILTGGGGGNDVNAGGGGGGNFTVGGSGGSGWTPSGAGCSPIAGGLGGIALNAFINAGRVYMGGGGGGGHENDGVGTLGGNGGGIILLKTGTLTTVACGGIIISANGITPPNNGIDGAGGGGAAGSLVFQVNAWNVAGGCPLSITANGGSGGSSNFGGAGAHGGGGGGGQGAIIFSTPMPTLNVNVNTLPGNGGTSCLGCAPGVNGGNGGGPNNAGIIVDNVGPLPIELVYFKAESMDTKVALSWETATERNTNYFIAEKSTDGVNWIELDKIKAAENSAVKLFYEQEDLNPLKGISYYRLRAIDLDHTEHISETQVIDRTNKAEYVIFYPNPTAEIFNIVTSGQAKDVTYEFFDISGKQVEVLVTEIQANKIIFNISALNRGIYFLNIKSPNGNKTNNKIIIK